MSVARTLGLAALVIAVVAPIAAGKSHRRRGRVVRVERTPPSKLLVPRLCSAINATDGSTSCWGHSVEAGEVGSIYDETGKRAMFRVETVTPQVDGCGNATAYNLTTSVLQGSFDQVSYSSYSVIDWDGGDHGRLIVNNGQIAVPSTRVGESVMAAFDSDGDETPELIVTYYMCDASGSPQPTGSNNYCMVYYQRNGGSYDALRTDIVRSC